MGYRSHQLVTIRFSTPSMMVALVLGRSSVLPKNQTAQSI